MTEQQVETQNDKPAYQSQISVGVTDLRTLVKVNWKGDMRVFIPEIQLTLTLPHDKKGAHMSRMIESIDEQINRAAHEVSPSLEELCKNILLDLEKRHHLNEATITLKTEYAVEEKSPASGKPSTEVHDIEIRVQYFQGTFRKWLTVKVVGSSACPHAMNNNDFGRTHLQRSKIKIVMGVPFEDEKVTFEKLIEVANKSFSSPVFTLVKSPDEQEIIRHQFENPKFVEDICRDVEGKIATEIGYGTVDITVRNEESIHRHDVIAIRNIDLDGF